MEHLTLAPSPLTSTSHDADKENLGQEPWNSDQISIGYSTATPEWTRGARLNKQAQARAQFNEDDALALAFENSFQTSCQERFGRPEHVSASDLDIGLDTYTSDLIDLADLSRATREVFDPPSTVHDHCSAQSTYLGTPDEQEPGNIATANVDSCSFPFFSGRELAAMIAEFNLAGPSSLASEEDNSPVKVPRHISTRPSLPPGILAEVPSYSGTASCSSSSCSEKQTEERSVSACVANCQSDCPVDFKPCIGAQLNTTESQTGPNLKADCSVPAIDENSGNSELMLSTVTPTIARHDKADSKSDETLTQGVSTYGTGSSHKATPNVDIEAAKKIRCTKRKPEVDEAAKKIRCTKREPEFDLFSPPNVCMETAV